MGIFSQGGPQVEQQVKSKARIKKSLPQFGCHKQTEYKYSPTYSNPHVSGPHLTGSNVICLLYDGIGQKSFYPYLGLEQLRAIWKEKRRCGIVS